MNKLYQVFVSSTYQDLIEERQKVIEALLGKNCFPIGMEYFPAAGDAQFTVIKKLIDRCDYFILILGGRYGSIEPKTGKSYTHLEFEYAISKGMPVASFYHAEPHKLPGEKIEDTDIGKKKLQEFKEIVQAERLCDSWKQSYELAFKVNKSLDYMFENCPRTGWIRATTNFIGISTPFNDTELMQLNEKWELNIAYNNGYVYSYFQDKIIVSWNSILNYLASFFLESLNISEETLVLNLTKHIVKISGNRGENTHIIDHSKVVNTMIQRDLIQRNKINKSILSVTSYGIVFFNKLLTFNKGE